MTAISAELLRRIDPREYYKPFLASKIYPDGRTVEEHRPFRLDMGMDRRAEIYGSALVQQSGACVSCAVELSVAPLSEEPEVLYELEAGEGVPEAAVEEANVCISKLLSSHRLIDPDSLHVGSKANGEPMAFELRWTLHLRIMVVCSDGPVVDAVLSAVQFALLDTKLPAVEYTGEALLIDQYKDIPLPFDVNKVKVWEVQSDDRDVVVGLKRELPPLTASLERRLVLKDHLQAMTFLLYPDEEKAIIMILADPTGELLSLYSSNRCDIVIGEDGYLYNLTFATLATLQPSNSSGINRSLVQRIVQLAARRHVKLAATVKKALVAGSGKGPIKLEESD